MGGVLTKHAPDDEGSLTQNRLNLIFFWTMCLVMTYAAGKSCILLGEWGAPHFQRILNSTPTFQKLPFQNRKTIKRSPMDIPMASRYPPLQKKKQPRREKNNLDFPTTSGKGALPFREKTKQKVTHATTDVALFFCEKRFMNSAPSTQNRRQ